MLRLPTFAFARCTHRVTITVSAVFLLIACRNSSPSGEVGGAVSTSPLATVAPASAGANKGACSLVTGAEATTALGAPATEDTKSAGASSRCTYDATTGGLIVIVSDKGKTPFDKGRASAAKSPGFTDLNGIGDGAFVMQGGPMASVMFYKGSFAVTIILTVQGAAKPPVDKAAALARVVVAKNTSRSEGRSRGRRSSCAPYVSVMETTDPG